jgi:hypothetical protein
VLYLVQVVAHHNAYYADKMIDATVHTEVSSSSPITNLVCFDVVIDVVQFEYVSVQMYEGMQPGAATADASINVTNALVMRPKERLEQSIDFGRMRYSLSKMIP